MITNGSRVTCWFNYDRTGSGWIATAIVYSHRKTDSKQANDA